MVGDIGGVAIADAHLRLQKKMRASDNDVYVCTPNYRPPDVGLGSQRFQEDVDMWSFGCVAVELYLRRPLIVPAATAATAAQAPSCKTFVDAIAAIVGRPGQEAVADAMPACAASWLDELPFFRKWYGHPTAWLTASAETAKAWPPPCLEGCPEGLVQLVQKCLVWYPSARMTIARARSHSFLQPPGQVPLHVRLATQPGKHGVGTIAEIDLDPDLLHYLQTCPSWNSLAEVHWKKGEPTSKCVRPGEAALNLKSEFPGFVDEENPPKCRSLNSDANLQLIASGRLAAFVRSIRKKWRPWLQQLGCKMREAVRADGMPETIYQKNGQPIMEEDFADNAFAYASSQMMEPGVRNDGWHTDGGTSLLHASLTLAGTRSVEVKVEGKPQVTLDQKPGSFYVGNMAALEHNVRHHEECKDTFEGAAVTATASAATAKPALAEGDERLQIAVMLRCDVFRECRARKIHAIPGPREFFRVVNYTVAQHLAEVPVALPDLTEVLAEVARTAAALAEWKTGVDVD